MRSSHSAVDSNISRATPKSDPVELIERATALPFRERNTDPKFHPAFDQGPGVQTSGCFLG